MSNVLNEAKKQQVIALGRLGWPLRRIEQETGVRRETAGAYLKAAGIGVRPPSVWGRRPPAKPANENEVTTGSEAAKPTLTINLNANPNPENISSKGKAKATSKPANANEVTTGFGVELAGLEVENPKRIPSASACEPFREAIELGLSRGRDATAIWQDLVAENGFDGGYQTVKRYVRKLRGNQPLQPRAVILTGPGEESQVDYGTGAMVRDPQTRKYRRTRLFVMVLGCSRKAARFLSFRSSSSSRACRLSRNCHGRTSTRFPRNPCNPRRSSRFRPSPEKPAHRGSIPFGISGRLVWHPLSYA